MILSFYKELSILESGFEMFLSAGRDQRMMLGYSKIVKFTDGVLNHSGNIAVECQFSHEMFSPLESSKDGFDAVVH